MPAKKSINLLPPLIDLPVYQEKYCDQDMTDTILRFLWEHTPEWIIELAEMEKGFIYSGHDGLYMKVCGRISEYLEEKEQAKEITLPDTRLGMLDLYYEMSRRIRKALGYIEVPVLGQALAPSPTGPFPPLINLPVQSKREGMDQEIVDMICQEIYKRSPEIIYENVEQFRRVLNIYQINAEVQKAIMEIAEQYNKSELASYIRLEITSRLKNMCGIREDFLKLREKALS